MASLEYIKVRNNMSHDYSYIDEKNLWKKNLADREKKNYVFHYDT